MVRWSRISDDPNAPEVTGARFRALQGRSAAACVGGDILPESVAFLRSQGFDIRLADLTEGPLTETFDVIVAARWKLCQEPDRSQSLYRQRGPCSVV